MKRIAVLALLVVFLVPSADAFPWKRVVKIAVVWGAPIGSSLLATKGGVDCRRRNGVEPCTQHYGEFHAFEAARGGFSVAMSTISWKCLSGTGDKACYSFAVGTTAFNLYWYRHEENLTRKPDLRLVEIVHTREAP